MFNKKKNKGRPRPFEKAQKRAKIALYIAIGFVVFVAGITVIDAITGKNLAGLPQAPELEQSAQSAQSGEEPAPARKVSASVRRWQKKANSLRGQMAQTQEALDALVAQAPTSAASQRAITEAQEQLGFANALLTDKPSAAWSEDEIREATRDIQSISSELRQSKITLMMLTR